MCSFSSVSIADYEELVVVSVFHWDAYACALSNNRRGVTHESAKFPSLRRKRVHSMVNRGSSLAGRRTEIEILSNNTNNTSRGPNMRDPVFSAVMNGGRRSMRRHIFCTLKFYTSHLTVWNRNSRHSFGVAC